MWAPNREKDDQENERGECKQAFGDRRQSLALANTTGKKRPVPFVK